MGLTIQSIQNTTSFSSLKSILNANFSEIQTAVDNFLDIYDSITSTIDLTLGSTGILIANKISIPLGNYGIDVGNTKIEDTKVTTSKLYAEAIVSTVNSIQFQDVATDYTAVGSGAINIAINSATLILNPTSAGFSVEITTPPNDEMRDLEIINLSQTDSVILNRTVEFIDSSLSTITIPSNKNLKLRYIIDVNTTLKGWYIVSHNGCTIV